MPEIKNVAVENKTRQKTTIKRQVLPHCLPKFQAQKNRPIGGLSIFAFPI